MELVQREEAEEISEAKEDGKFKQAMGRTGGAMKSFFSRRKKVLILSPTLIAIK